MTSRRFIGFDWFKLIVAVALALLLLILGMGNNPSTASTSATSTTAPTSASIAAAPTAAATLAPTTAPSIAPTIAATPTSATTTAPTSEATNTAATTDATSTLPAPSLDAPSENSLTAGNVTLTGTGSPGGQVEVIIDGTLVGKAAVGADGTWTLPTDLTAGDHEIVVRALDASGSVIAESPATHRTVSAPSASDATATNTTVATTAATASTTEPTTATSSPATATPAPAATVAPAIGGAPTITFPSDSAQVPAGPLTLRGTGTPGSALEVLDSDKVLGTATVGTDGTWTLPITSGDGTAAYSVRPAGSQDVSARPIRVTIGSGQAATSASLTVGSKAWVTRANGRSLRLRAGAGLTKTVISRLPVGTEMTLLEGPQAQDGYTWWRVRTLGDQTGWVAGEELRTQPD